MSTSDSSGRARSDVHVVDELAALMGGELDLDSTRFVTRHLRACDACRQELVEVAAGIGVMRRIDGAAAPDAVPTTPVASTASTGRSRSRWLAVSAAALLVAAIAVGATLFATRDGESDRTVVSLAPVEGATATGEVAMRDAGSAQAMEVKTSLGAAPEAGYYEVWLLDSETGKMLPVGVLPPDGTGEFRLPSSLLESYDTVDISLQPDDGTTEHSNDSLLRADYA